MSIFLNLPMFFFPKNKIGATAQKTIERLFSKQNIVTKLLALYETDTNNISIKSLTMNNCSFITMFY